MNEITPYLTYAIALGIAAIIPGPGIAALVGQTLGGSARSAFFFLGGLMLGDITYLSFAILGLAAIAQHFAGAFLALKLAGGAYLIYLAYKMWTNHALATKINKERVARGSSAFIAGYTVTMGNPKTVVFYLAILPNVLPIDAVNFNSWVVLSVLTALVLLASLSPYIYLAAKARGFLKKPEAIHRLERFAASVIGAAGLLILGEAARQIMRGGKV